MLVAPMMVNLVVRISRINLFPLGFFFSNSHTFGDYFCHFIHVYKRIFNILVCKYLDMMYSVPHKVTKQVTEWIQLNIVSNII